PPKADIGAQSRDVRFVPKADSCTATKPLFDCRVGACQQIRRHSQPQCLSGLQVDDQLVGSRQLGRKVCRLVCQSEGVPAAAIKWARPELAPCGLALTITGQMGPGPIMATAISPLSFQPPSKSRSFDQLILGSNQSLSSNFLTSVWSLGGTSLGTS